MLIDTVWTLVSHFTCSSLLMCVCIHTKIVLTLVNRKLLFKVKAHYSCLIDMTCQSNRNTLIQWGREDRFSNINKTNNSLITVLPGKRRLWYRHSMWLASLSSGYGNANGRSAFICSIIRESQVSLCVCVSRLRAVVVWHANSGSSSHCWGLHLHLSLSMSWRVWLTDTLSSLSARRKEISDLSTSMASGSTHKFTLTHQIDWGQTNTILSCTEHFFFSVELPVSVPCH